MPLPAHYHCQNFNLSEYPSEGTAVWQAVQREFLVDAVSGEMPKQITLFQIIRDDSQQKLFVRFERKAEEIFSNFKLRDEPLWKQDVFELFVCDENVLSTYKEFQSSPWDVLFDGMITFDQQGRHSLNVSWNAEGWESKSTFYHRDKKLCSVWSLPYEVFTDSPRPNTSWRMGVFAASLMPQGQDLMAWQKTGVPNFHIPELFGFLDFE